MADPYLLLRDALRQLSLEPEAQRKALPGTVVTDELALDLNNAVQSIQHAKDEAGFALPAEIVSAVVSLNETLSAPPNTDLWERGALDRHPAWAQARTIARQLLPLIPQRG